MKEKGKVFLVGAGPGDPDLLTLKAHKIISSVDIILYDQLISKEILDLIPVHVEKIYTGKKFQNHTLPQKDINQKIVDSALAGLNVCRLKGGDPFILGRGGEEVEVLHQEGIEVSVVPGITAAVGCGAYGLLPLTHRDMSNGFTVISASGRCREYYDIDWPSLVKLDHTIVFYMGIHKISWIRENLIKSNMDLKTPIAIVSEGTTQNHKQIITSLESIEEDIKENPPAMPAIIVVGKTVGLFH